MRDSPPVARRLAVLCLVADHLLYEPCSGLLRGDSGAFFSRAGSSVDQAGLMCALLGAAGIDTRHAGGSEIDQPAAVSGVIAHLAERVVAGEVFPREGEDPAISVGGVMDAVSDSGIGLRLIDTVESAAELPYEPEARSVLERSVAEGWLAVAPERPVAIDGRERVGWWLIDPLSGRVSDQFEDGRGSELFTELLLKLVGGFLGAMAAIYAGKVLYQKFTEARDEVKEKVKASFAEGLND